MVGLLTDRVPSLSLHGGQKMTKLICTIVSLDTFCLSYTPQ